MLRATECLRAAHLELRPISAPTPAVFAGVRTVVTEPLPVSAQFWQNRCQCLHSFDRTVAGVCTVLTEPLPVYAQFWQNRCRFLHSFDRTVAGVCTVLTEPSGSLVGTETVVQNFSTQLLILLKSGNSAYFRRPNFRCVIIMFSLNGSMFNAQWGPEH